MGGENSTQTTKLKFKEKPNPLKESKKEEKEEEEKKEIDKEEEEKKNLMKNLFILKKSLEAKRANKNQMKEKFKKAPKIFNDESLSETLDKISTIFIDFLQPINEANKNKIKNIVNILYKTSRNPNEFSKKVDDVFENIVDYSKLRQEEEEKILNYIYKKIKDNEKILEDKEVLKSKYKSMNYIINYDDFTRFVKNYDFILDGPVIEVLLYKMKVNIPLDQELSLDTFNFKIFVDFLEKYDKENENLNYSMNENGNNIIDFQDNNYPKKREFD